MRLVPFVAHTDPHVHPVYGESWAWSLTHEVFTYDQKYRMSSETVGAATGNDFNVPHFCAGLPIIAPGVVINALK
jgi:hypothetical protein